MATISSNDIIVNYKIGDASALNQLLSKFEKISEEERQVSENAKKVSENLKKAGTEGKTAGDNISRGMGNARTETDKMVTSLKSVGQALGIAFSAAAIQQFAKQIFTTTAAFEGLRTTIDFATEGQMKSGQAFNYLIALANKYGKDLQTLAGTYSSFTAASNLAGIKLTESNKIFEAAVKASTALGKSNEDTQGILLAFSQIVSKGTVQAEELRGQIGERIPGAFNLAAKAMGVTTLQLNKMLQQGQVISADFLPKFAIELDKAFGATAEAKVNSLSASLGRFTTAWDRFLESPLISKYLAETLNLFTVAFDKIRSLTMTETEKREAQELKIEQNITTNLKNELNARLKQIQATTNKEATLDQVALQKFTETQNYRSKLIDQLAQLRMKAAGSLNKAELQQAEQNLKYADIVLKALEEQIKGVEILSQTKKELTKEDIKLLQEEFNSRKKILELEKQYRTLQGELAGDPIARLASERRYYEGLAKLQQEFANKGLAIKKMEIDITKMESQKAAQEQADAEAKMQIQTKDGLKAFNDARKAENDKRAKEEEARRLAQMDRTKASNEAELQAYKDLQQQKADAREEAEKQAYDLVVSLTNSVFELQSQYAAAEMARKNRQFDEEIRLADGNVQKITEIEEKRRMAEKEYKLKEFRANQTQAIANAIFTAAPFIIKYSAGLPITAANLTLTLAALAAQTGFILAQPVPEFAKGVENFEGGAAIVGEKGRELVRTDNGLFLTPDKATLTYLPKGSDVITAPKTRELLQGNSTFLKRQTEWQTIDTSPIAAAIKGIPVQSLEISERGLERYVTKGNRTTKILNKKRGANL